MFATIAQWFILFGNGWLKLFHFRSERLDLFPYFSFLLIVIVTFTIVSSLFSCRIQSKSFVLVRSKCADMKTKIKTHLSFVQSRINRSYAREPSECLLTFSKWHLPFLIHKCSLILPMAYQKLLSLSETISKMMIGSFIQPASILLIHMKPI